jgi:hypothetical protein
LEGYIGMANAEANHFTEKLESELKWLEGHIRDLRREVERGQLFDQINLVTAAARVSYSAGKLRAAQENIEIFKTLAEGE